MHAATVVASLWLAASGQRSAPCSDVLPRAEIRALVENDVFFTDRYYTSGLGLTGHLPATARSPKLDVASVAEMVTETMGRGPLCARQWRFGVQQRMFTPHRYWDRRVPRFDHPFGEWGYGVVERVASGPRDHIVLAAEVGVLGPLALAESLQDIAHKTVSPASPGPGGWRHEVAPGPGLGVRVEARHVVLAFDTDADARIAEVGVDGQVRVGNVYIDAVVGPYVRLGYFGRNAPSGAARDGPLAFWTSDPELSVVFNVRPRVVVHDTFLDGTLDGRSPHRTAKNPLLLTSYAGLRGAMGPLLIEARIERTSAQMPYPTTSPHAFWSIQLGLRL